MVCSLTSSGTCAMKAGTPHTFLHRAVSRSGRHGSGSTVLIGMALLGWGVTQGERSTRFYASLATVGYVFGVTLRGVDLSRLLTFTPVPRIGWITGETARLSITVAHLALINLVLKSGLGLRNYSGQRAEWHSHSNFVEPILDIWVLFSATGFNL
jgi:uncharacterized protein